MDKRGASVFIIAILMILLVVSVIAIIATSIFKATDRTKTSLAKSQCQILNPESEEYLDCIKNELGEEVYESEKKLIENSKKNIKSDAPADFNREILSNCLNLPSGLIGCYAFENNFLDGSERGNDGIRYGTGFSMIVTGNNVSVYDGINDYVQTNASKDFVNVVVQTKILENAPVDAYVAATGSGESKTYSQMSTSFWIKDKSLVGSGTGTYNYTVIGHSPTGNIADNFYVIYRLNKNPTLLNNVEFVSYKCGFVTAPVPRDFSWHNIAITKGINNYKIYVDGVLKNTSSCSEGGLSKTPLYIGKDSGNTFGRKGGWLNASLDYLLLFNRSLTGAEVNGIYNSQKNLFDISTGGLGNPKITAFFANPLSVVAYGQKTNISWYSTNALYCEGSGAWNGTKPVNGNQSVIVNSLSNFTLTCFGTSGFDRKSIFVQNGESVPTQAWITQAHFSVPTALEYSNDGSFLVSTGFDKVVKIWNATTGQNILTISDNSSVRTVAISKDNKLIASGADDSTIKIWNVSNGVLIITIPFTHLNSPRGLAFSLDGKKLFSAGEDSFPSGSDYIKTWNVSNGALISNFSAHSDWIVSLDYSDDGKMFATGSFDNKARLWNASNGALIYNIINFNDVFSVDLSSDGNGFASGGKDDNVNITYIKNGFTSKKIFVTNDVWGVKYSPNSKYIVTSDYDRYIKVWDSNSALYIGGYREAVSPVGYGYVLVGPVVFSPDGSKFAYLRTDGKLVMVDSPTTAWP